MDTLVDNAWLIAILPLASAILTTAFGRHLPLKGSEIGIATMFVAWIHALAIGFHTFVNAPFEASERFFRWSPLGDGFVMELGQYVDGLTAMMLVLVTTVSLMVHIYSREYMHGEERFTYFFAMLGLFTFSMLVLVLANNTLQAVVGWELVGLCSFLLIGFYWHEKPNQDAANKAFLTTKFADIGLIVGVIVLSSGLVEAGIETPFNIEAQIDFALSGNYSQGTLILGTLMIFLGAVGKSGQMPLHVWLPDAMAGPTPVSALIHAATMVTAGVFFVARLYPIYAQSEVVLATIAIVGTITLFFAGFVALVQDDIKKVLAYSTISQLGYMMAALGVGGYTAGIFHLFTHGFFKALLFLGSGSLIHAVHSNNMSDMGGMRKFMPITFVTFVFGSLALAGFPLTAGFFSKEEILVASTFFTDYGIFTGNLVFWLGLAGSFVTTFYMARAIFLIFFGEHRGAHHGHSAHTPSEAVADEDLDDTAHAEDAHQAAHDDHHGEPHESGFQMAMPLVLLAVASIPVGLAGSFLWPSTSANFEQWTATEAIEYTYYPFVAGEETARQIWLDHKNGVSDDHQDDDEHDDDHGDDHSADVAMATTDIDIVANESAQLIAAAEGDGHGDDYVKGAVLHGPPHFDPALAGGSLLIFLLAVGLAWRIYGNGLPEKDPTIHKMGFFSKALINKYWFDYLGFKFIVKPVRDDLAAATYRSSNAIDEIVRGTGVATVDSARVAYVVDQKIVDGGINGAAFSAAWWSERVKKLQSGNVQRYAGAIVAAVIVLAVVFATVSS